MMWRCRILGHDGPWHLDANHPGHCRRCREPHPEWLEGRRRMAIIRAAGKPARDRGWWTMSGDDFIAALRQAYAGEDPELVYAEWYANSEVENP